MNKVHYYQPVDGLRLVVMAAVSLLSAMGVAGVVSISPVGTWATVALLVTAALVAEYLRDGESE